MATLPRILMCAPDFYGIEYEINPWMHRSVKADVVEAQRQWTVLVALLQSLGAEIELLSGVPGLPDLVFTANAALIWRDRAYLSRFRHAARQGETPVAAEWFQQHGFQTLTFPESLNFEGAGDALFCGPTLVGGYLVRSDARALQWLGTELRVPVLPLQLVDQHYYHLDTCFCPLDAETAVWFPEAFDAYGRAALTYAIPHLIPVDSTEAAAFACNAVVLGKHVVVNTGCPGLESRLLREGWIPHPTPLTEFLKAGGSAKCLTLRLDGEDAAAWRMLTVTA